MLNKNQLEQLRKEIVLNSLYYSDYKNSFGIDTHLVCDFFDGYLEFLFDRFSEDVKKLELNKSTKNFNVFLDKHDNVENLEEWYNIFETDPLPIPNTIE